MANDSFQPSGPQAANSISLGRLALLLLAALALLGYFVVRPDSVRAVRDELGRMLGHESVPVPSAPAKIPRRAHGPLDAMTPQAQAELLLDEATHNEEGALEDLNARLDGWRGYLQMTPRLEQEMEPAVNAGDLRVRAAALEIYLDVYDIAKQPESLSTLERRITAEPESRLWALYALGALGNRGVDPVGVERKLSEYANDSSEETRVWAVEGLAVLGTSEAVDPLLEALRTDPSPRVRERAACGLAESGMFTHEQRMSAVPRLLELAEDTSLDGTTRGHVFHALQDITHAGRGSDVHAWREWWNHHSL